MGLMLSVLVFSVGVIEALSCMHHFRVGYLPLSAKRERLPPLRYPSPPPPASPHHLPPPPPPPPPPPETDEDTCSELEEPSSSASSVQSVVLNRKPASASLEDARSTTEAEWRPSPLEDCFEPIKEETKTAASRGEASPAPEDGGYNEADRNETALYRGDDSRNRANSGSEIQSPFDPTAETELAYDYRFERKSPVPLRVSEDEGVLRRDETTTKTNNSRNVEEYEQDDSHDVSSVRVMMTHDFEINNINVSDVRNKIRTDSVEESGKLSRQGTEPAEETSDSSSVLVQREIPESESSLKARDLFEDSDTQGTKAEQILVGKASPNVLEGEKSSCGFSVSSDALKTTICSGLIEVVPTLANSSELAIEKEKIDEISQSGSRNALDFTGNVKEIGDLIDGRVVELIQTRVDSGCKRETSSETRGLAIITPENLIEIESVKKEANSEAALITTEQCPLSEELDLKSPTVTTNGESNVIEKCIISNHVSRNEEENREAHTKQWNEGLERSSNSLTSVVCENTATDTNETNKEISDTNFNQSVENDTILQLRTPEKIGDNIKRSVEEPDGISCNKEPEVETIVEIDDRVVEVIDTEASQQQVIHKMQDGVAEVVTSEPIEKNRILNVQIEAKHVSQDIECIEESSTEMQEKFEVVQCQDSSQEEVMQKIDQLKTKMGMGEAIQNSRILDAQIEEERVSEDIVLTKELPVGVKQTTEGIPYKTSSQEQAIHNTDKRETKMTISEPSEKNRLLNAQVEENNVSQSVIEEPCVEMHEKSEIISENKIEIVKSADLIEQPTKEFNVSQSLTEKTGQEEKGLNDEDSLPDDKKASTLAPKHLKEIKACEDKKSKVSGQEQVGNDLVPPLPKNVKDSQDKVPSEEVLVKERTTQKCTKSETTKKNKKSSKKAVKRMSSTEKESLKKKDVIAEANAIAEETQSNNSNKQHVEENLVTHSDKNEQIVENLVRLSSFNDDSEDGCETIQMEPAWEPSSSSSEKAFWLIFSGEYTKAMSKDWHSGHFCCWQCDESLTGQRYVLRDDHPYCIKCYESVFANSCEECNRIIGIDSKDLSYKDKHWHEACFLCSKCRVSLVDKQFGSKADKIYCGNCYDAQFASRCDGCGQIFRAGTKKMEYKTRQWHEQCFCCCVCKTPIGTKSFIPREQEIYCATCYEEKFATRCIKCNKIITSGGVTYKNEPWHRECFTCTNCNTSLAGQRFTSRDEKPYCADCFGELFAKRCTACCKPITGIGGTRFISFEDRHWHNDCFICAACKTSLVGRGFITDAEDIICPECAKQKLI